MLLAGVAAGNLLTGAAPSASAGSPGDGARLPVAAQALRAGTLPLVKAPAAQGAFAMPDGRPPGALALTPAPPLLRQDPDRSPARPLAASPLPQGVRVGDVQTVPGTDLRILVSAPAGGARPVLGATATPIEAPPGGLQTAGEPRPLAPMVTQAGLAGGVEEPTGPARLPAGQGSSRTVLPLAR
jgi:hypothetical protein